MPVQEVPEHAVKDAAKKAWMEAWKQAIGTEEMEPVTRRAAENRFEKWWSLNGEPTDS